MVTYHNQHPKSLKILWHIWHTPPFTIFPSNVNSSSSIDRGVAKPEWTRKKAIWWISHSLTGRALFRDP